MQLRIADAQDAVALAQVKDAIWPQEITSPDYIAQVLQQPDHHTLIALEEQQTVGFVDSFLTLGPDGQRRWEIDLLGVHPTYQRRGIGSHLIQATTSAGWQMSAEKARALVAAENRGSQKAFTQAGYKMETRPLNLWVSTTTDSQSPIHNSQLPTATHLIPVTTLNYRGVWLEGQLSAEAFRAAQVICLRMSWDIAGVLISVTDDALNRAAHQANYAFINQFQFWQQIRPDTS